MEPAARRLDGRRGAKPTPKPVGPIPMYVEPQQKSPEPVQAQRKKPPRDWDDALAVTKSQVRRTLTYRPTPHSLRARRTSWGVSNLTKVPSEFGR